MEYKNPNLDPNYRDELLIGTINFETDITDECNIEVYGKEESTPHFHIFNTDKSFETCICIYSNYYFVHGKYKDTLNEKQVNQLVNWLESPNDKNNKLTNWEAVALFWEFANRECKFPESLKVTTMPDYTKLNDTAKVY